MWSKRAELGVAEVERPASSQRAVGAGKESGCSLEGGGATEGHWEVLGGRGVPITGPASSPLLWAIKVRPSCRGPFRPAP